MIRTMKHQLKVKVCKHVLVTYRRKKTNKQRLGKKKNSEVPVKEQKLNRINVMVKISSFSLFSKRNARIKK